MSESVMVVEDEGLVALELEECLRQMGYEVPAVAATGAEALAKASQIRPDLILMDIRLKGEMDGIEAARQIMDGLAVPVVYLTAHSDDATVRRARETAPFGYVLKPWEEKSLQIAIDIALHKARAEAEIRNERDWYLSVLRYAGAPMLVCNADGTVRLLNAAAEQLLGAAARGALGRKLEHVLDLREESGGASLARSLAGDVAEKRIHSVRPLVLRAGAAESRVDVSTWPIKDESGANLGFIVVMRPEPAGQPPIQANGRPVQTMSLDEYVQTELIRLLVLQEQGTQQADRFLEGQLEAYRRLMRDYLGRDLPESGRVDWKEHLVRRAVRDAHEQTKAVLLGRPDIAAAGRLLPGKLARYLEVLCTRLVSPNGCSPQKPGAQVDVKAMDLDLDTGIYCVLLVNEIVQAAVPAGRPRRVSVSVQPAETGSVKLIVALERTPGTSAPPVTPVLNALVTELGASLAVASDPDLTWTVRFPLPAAP